MTPFHVEFGNRQVQDDFRSRYEPFLESLGSIYELCSSVILAVEVKSDPDRIGFVVGNQIVEDFNEILLLTANGLSTGALKILPGMFERTVTIRYLETHKDEAENLSEFFWVEEYEKAVIARKYHPGTVSRSTFRRIRDSFNKVKDTFAVTCDTCGEKAGGYRWSRNTLDQMATQCGLQELLFSAYYDPREETTFRLASSRRRIRVGSDGSHRYDNGPKPEIDDSTLRIAHYLLLVAIETLKNHFGRDELSVAVKASFDDFRRVWQVSQTNSENPNADNRDLAKETSLDEPSLYRVLSLDEHNTRASMQVLSEHGILAAYERMPLLFHSLLDAVQRQFESAGRHPLIRQNKDGSFEGASDFVLRMQMALSADQQFTFAAGHLFRGHVSEVHAHVRRAIEGAGIAHLSKSEPDLSTLFYNGERREFTTRTKTHKILPKNNPLTSELKKSLDIAAGMLHNNFVSLATRSKHSYSEKDGRWHFEGRLEYYEVNDENPQWFLQIALWTLRMAERVARLLAASFDIEDLEWLQVLEDFRAQIDSLYVELRPILAPLEENQVQETGSAGKLPAGKLLR